VLCFQAEAESKEAEQLKKSKNNSSCLSALILRDQQSRELQTNAFLDGLAAKYGGQDESSKAANKTKRSTKSSASKYKTASKAKK